jgi:hypothetical protein
MTDTMRLYRGIAVKNSDAVSVVETIQRDGLATDDRFWSGLVHDLKPRLEHLWQSADLSTAMTRPKDEPARPRICACINRQDAMYYACSHNRTREHTTSVLIAFDADPKDVVIDGRDFLYTVAQLGNPTASREMLGRVFGPAVLRYVDRAWEAPEQQTRIACCDLATQDPDVIRAHAANALVIGGRFFTRFSSAVMVTAPIPAERSVSVEPVGCSSYELPDLDIELQEALGRHSP